MLYCVIGRSGHGKTEYLMTTISERISTRSFVIVPEQQSVEMEQQLSKNVGDIYNMYCEVVNFDRLPERISRDIGGVKEKYIDTSGKDIILSAVLEELSEVLEQYKNTYRSADHIKKILSELEQLKRYMITPDYLGELSKKTEITDVKLSKKLSDLSLILSSYNKKFQSSLDPSDAMERIVEKIDGMNYFDGMNVYIDGYYSYTGKEMALVSEILRSAKDVYITFCLDDDEMFAENMRTYKAIKQIASTNHVKTTDVFLKHNIRHKTKELRYLEANMWNYGAKPIENSENVMLFRCKDVFEESSVVASQIRKFIREGYRFSDIGIALRDASEYNGVLDVVLKKYDIPCFMSIKEELSSKSIIALTLSLIELAISDFSVQSVKNYIKSSYSTLTLEERDVLDAYVTMWDLRGEGMYKKTWKMNPRGYKEELTKDDILNLKLVNGAKNKFYRSVCEFVRILKGKSLTYSIAANVLYDHLISINADEKLLEKAKLYRELGEEDRCVGLLSVWSVMIKLIDQLHEVGGDGAVKLRGFLETLKMMISEYEIGLIPTSNDEVTVGEAQLMRFTDKKILFIMGVNEGVFPSNSVGSDLFTERERKTLDSFNFEATLTSPRAQCREHFLFYRTAVSPSEKLIISYTMSGTSGDKRSPSVAVMSVSRLFDDLEAKEIDVEFLIENKNTALEYFSKLPKDVKAYLESQGVEQIDGITPNSETINIGVDSLYLSPSSVERYGLCPFSFFGKYLLALRETKKAKFENSETGTFIHKLLEDFMCEHSENIREVTDDMIETSVKRNAAEFAKVFVPNDELTNRFEYRLKRLTVMAVEIIKNLRDEFISGDFEPREFERRVSASIDFDDDTTKLSGIIDRVDVLEHEGKRLVRIVDYKTGQKELRLDDVLDGLSLQMLLYLFSYCKETDSYPCGAMYMYAAAPDEQEDKSGNFKEKLKKSLKRSGIFIDDIDILMKMEHGGVGTYLPVKMKKDGTLYKNSPVLSETGFNELEQYIYEYIRKTASSIRNGKLGVRPVVNSKTDACKYCKLRPLCRVTEDMKIARPILDEKMTKWAEKIRKETSDGMDGVADQSN